MKKKLFLLTIITIFISVMTFAQAPLSGKYNYAEVTIRLGGFNKHKGTSINFGTDYSFPVEKKEEIVTKVNSFKEAVDIKNYLSEKGWEYVDVHSMLFAEMVVVYIFRKTK